MSGFVYFIECGGNIKIGFSTDVEKRLRTLGIGNPLSLNLLGVSSGTVSFERALHHRLRPYRCKGEWFSDCAAVRETINAVLAKGYEAIDFVEPEPCSVADKIPLAPDVWGIVAQRMKYLYGHYELAIARAPAIQAKAMILTFRRAFDDAESAMDGGLPVPDSVTYLEHELIGICTAERCDG